MFINNRLKRLFFVIAVILFLSNLGPIQGLADFESYNDEIVVELHDDFFNPDTVTLPNEETTILILQNKGVKDHTFTVRYLAIDVEVRPGEEKRVSVRPERAGTYELICRFHAQEGMVGQVVVE